MTEEDYILVVNLQQLVAVVNLLNDTISCKEFTMTKRNELIDDLRECRDKLRAIVTIEQRQTRV